MRHLEVIRALERLECGHGDEITAWRVVRFTLTLAYVRAGRAQEFVRKVVARIGISDAQRLARLDAVGKALALRHVKNCILAQQRDKPR